MIYKKVRKPKVGPRSRNKSFETVLGRKGQLVLPTEFDVCIGQRVFLQVIRPKVGRWGGSMIISKKPRGSLRDGARYQSIRVQRRAVPLKVHQTPTWKLKHE